MVTEPLTVGGPRVTFLGYSVTAGLDGTMGQGGKVGLQIAKLIGLPNLVRLGHLEKFYHLIKKSKNAQNSQTDQPAKFGEASSMGNF